MKIIILKEKHGDIYIEWPEEKEKQELIAKTIFESRKKEGYYYDVGDAILEQIINTNKCFSFLKARTDYEYEDFEIEELLDNYPL